MLSELQDRRLSLGESNSLFLYIYIYMYSQLNIEIDSLINMPSNSEMDRSIYLPRNIF